MSWIDVVHSTDWDQAIGIWLFAYLLGCFTAGYYLVRFTVHQDIRDIGSGGVGARNVSRLLGKPGFVLTGLSDFFKGVLAVWLARRLTSDDGVVAVAMLAVVAGHIWPVQLRFRGGKGMAASLGALVIYDPLLSVVFLVLFLCLAAVLRRTVLPGLLAVGSLPLVSLSAGDSPARIVFFSLLAGVVLVAHRRNLVEEFSQLAARRPFHPKTDRTRP